MFSHLSDAFKETRHCTFEDFGWSCVFLPVPCEYSSCARRGPRGERRNGTRQRARSALAFGKCAVRWRLSWPSFNRRCYHSCFSHAVLFQPDSIRSVWSVCAFIVLSFLVISVPQLLESYLLLEDPLNLHSGEAAVLNSSH